MEPIDEKTTAVFLTEFEAECFLQFQRHFKMIKMMDEVNKTDIFSKRFKRT